MIEWYKSKDLGIFFSENPQVAIRYILPSMTEKEVKSIKKIKNRSSYIKK